MLVECAIYMTFLNCKPVEENYFKLKEKVIKEGIDLHILKKLLKEAANANPEKIERLYKQLKWRFNRIKSHKDPVLNNMVKSIIEESNKNTFKSELNSLFEYLVSNGEIKKGSRDRLYTNSLETYNKCISTGKDYKEAALRSLISIPLNMSGKYNSSNKMWALLSMFGLLALFGSLVAIAVIDPRFRIPLIASILVFILTGGRYYLLVY